MIKYKDIEITISDNALKVLNDYKQFSNNAHEVGGQLFGNRNDSKFVITDCSLTKKIKKSSRISFWPCLETEQNDIIEYKKRDLDYFGDWHTHPQKRPIPSYDDVESVRRNFISMNHRLPFFLLIVIGLARFPLGVSVSIITKDMFEELKIDE